MLLLLWLRRDLLPVCRLWRVVVLDLLSSCGSRRTGVTGPRLVVRRPASARHVPCEQHLLLRGELRTLLAELEQHVEVWRLRVVPGECSPAWLIIAVVLLLLLLLHLQLLLLLLELLEGSLQLGWVRIALSELLLLRLRWLLVLLLRRALLL